MFKVLKKLFSKSKAVRQRDASFYDALFRSGGHRQQYRVHYSDCVYFEVWRRGEEILSTLGRPPLVDIGCGPGQFAQFLFDSGYSDYTGIDHSPVAIEMSRNRVPAWNDRFIVADAFTLDSLAGSYEAAVMFEVLEHIERDLDLLATLPSGVHTVFSVPSYGSASHVRSFSSSRQVRKRYETIIDIASLEALDGCPEDGKTIYLVHGVRK